MNANLIILSAVLVVGVTACGQKSDADKTTVGKDVAQPAQQAVVKEPVPQVPNKQPVEIKAAAKVANNGEKKSTGAVAEQVSAGAVDQAQEAERPQMSAAKQRGQAAEDEMMMEIAKRK